MLYFLVLLYTVLLLLRPQEFIAGLQPLAPLQVTLLTALGFWLFLPRKGWELPQFKLAGPFLFIAAVGMGLNGWWGGGVFLLEKVLPPILAAMLLAGAVRSVRQLRGYLLLLVAIACLIVLHGHLQLQNGTSWTGAEPINGRMTYSGIFDDPNDIGLLLIIAVAAILYLFGLTRSRLLRLLMLAVLGWLFYGVMLTDSRGTMLGILAVFVVHMWRSLGKKSLIIVGLLAVVMLSLGSRLAEIDPEEESAAGRIDAWIEGLGMLRHNPLFGVGYGNFTDYNPLTAHNTIVLAFAELGLLGYIVWLAMIGYSGYMTYWVAIKSEVWAKAAGRELPADYADEVAAARMLMVACIGFAVGAFFLSQSFKPLIYLMCGLAMGRYMGVAERIGPLPPLSFLRDIRYWLAASIGSVVGIYALVKVAG